MTLPKGDLGSRFVMSVPLPAPEKQPLIPLLDAAEPLGIARTSAYLAAARGEFPIEVLRIGRRLVVRNADLRRYLGL